MSEGAVIDVVDVGFFVGVTASVIFEDVLLGEGYGIEVIFERSFFVVDTIVFLEVGFFKESFIIFRVFFIADL